MRSRSSFPPGARPGLLRGARLPCERRGLDWTDVLRTGSDFAQAADVIAALPVWGHCVKHLVQQLLERGLLLRRQCCQWLPKRRTPGCKHALGDAESPLREKQSDESQIR